MERTEPPTMTSSTTEAQDFGCRTAGLVNITIIIGLSGNGHKTPPVDILRIAAGVTPGSEPALATPRGCRQRAVSGPCGREVRLQPDTNRRTRDQTRARG